MAYGNWGIDEVLTRREYGYCAYELTYGSNKPVKVRCEECGVVAIKRFREAGRKHRCASVVDGKKKCFKCKTFKGVECFSKNRSTADGYQKVCKECFANYDCVKASYQKKSQLIKTSLLAYFGHKIPSLKNRSKRLNVAFDLNKEFLLSLYNKQNKRCFFSNIKILHNSGVLNYNSISIDRLDPLCGYTKNNVVLCAFAINSLKFNLNEQEFKTFLSECIPPLMEYAKKG